MQSMDDSKDSGINEENISLSDDLHGENSHALKKFIKSLSLRICSLEHQLRESELKNRHNKAKIQKILQDKTKFEHQLSKYLNKDQLEVIRGKRKVKWSSKTIAKALYIRRKGKSVLESVREHFAPLPCLTTLNKHIEKFKISPGFIEENIKVLAKKCETLKTAENYFYLAFDEMSTIPGISKDPSTKKFMGYSTLPENFNVQADQLLLFVVMGLHTRIKSNVAFHFTKKGTTTGKNLLEFIKECIFKIESECNVIIKGLAFDLSALDCSLIKELGIKFNAVNQTYYFNHPDRPNEIIFLSPDGTHNSKNLNQGCKNHDVIISRSLKDEFNLSSSRASIKDVEKIFKNDEKHAFKLMPKVNEVVLHTKHFQKMNPLNASKFHSSDVISAINFIKSSSTDTQNATSFILMCFHFYHKIITSRDPWKISDKEKYDCDVEFLEWFSDKLLPNIIIGKGNMKSIYGARMGIKSIIHLSRECFAMGYVEFFPSRLLTNPVENQFSVLRDLTPKPSGPMVCQSLRIMSVCPFQFNPIKGVYRWDENDSTTVDYLEFLKEIINQPLSHDQDEIQFSCEIQVPKNIQWRKLMNSKEEYAAFICHMSLFLNNFLKTISCAECKLWMVANAGHAYDRLEEFELLFMRLRSDPEQYKLIPSLSVVHHFLQLEYLFQHQSSLINPVDPIFEESFVENLPGIDVDLSSIHCMELFNKIGSKYLDFRLKLQLHSRHLQKANKFSSGSLRNID